MPSTPRLADDLSIPFVAAIQPFADLDEQEEPVPVVECGESGPARCEKCGGYVNPWCTWTSGGTRWQCNLCSHETRGESVEGPIAMSDSSQFVKVEPEYFSALDANFTRLDYSERPELQKGTVDFDASQSTNYWAFNPPQLQHLSLANAPSDPTSSDAARKPEMMRYVFALDTSNTSVLSGFLMSACVALGSILFGRSSEDGSEPTRACLPPGCSIALITFDDALHFYDLSVCSVPV